MDSRCSFCEHRGSTGKRAQSNALPSPTKPGNKEEAPMKLLGKIPPWIYVSEKLASSTNCPFMLFYLFIDS